MKNFIAAGLVFAAVLFCRAQSYQFRSVLDPNGEFLIRWNVYPDQKDIEMRFEVKTKGWISLLIASRDGSYADVWFGGYDDVAKEGYHGVCKSTLNQI